MNESGPGWELRQGDVLAELGRMEDNSVHCVVTSPPYWGLRDYGVKGQIGLEETIEEYIAKIVEVFEQVRRVLRPDGTLWLNLGDSYAGSWCGNSMRPGGGSQRPGLPGFQPLDARVPPRNGYIPKGLKRKDLMGIPWRIAFSLQGAGWWLRSDIIWSKPNPMPESVTDRPTRAHEYLFLLTKAERYYYNADAIREPLSPATKIRITQPTFDRQTGGPKDNGTGNRSHRKALRNLHAKHEDENGKWRWNGSEFHTVPDSSIGANKRTVWEIPTHPYTGGHFATFPEKLVRPCVLAGCPDEGLVMDPFAGSGTVGIVALDLGRRFVGIELKPEYSQMAAKRLRATPWQTQIPEGSPSK
ncbi:hypothetical protein LCGC14_0441180 [marine sediment metagenome]|uniref:site-specific DNA-methyltransferase (cytosine-N(4)-specific) n=1 Tax=marine sediment metagenome TaxID=412755 RepID=A0A0F9V7A8_9ZZZZ